MKLFSIFISIFLTIITLLLTGCQNPSNGYHETKKYSDMPWNTQQSWEGSRQIPGMSR